MKGVIIAHGEGVVVLLVSQQTFFLLSSLLILQGYDGEKRHSSLRSSSFRQTIDGGGASRCHPREREAAKRRDAAPTEPKARRGGSKRSWSGRRASVAAFHAAAAPRGEGRGLPSAFPFLSESTSSASSTPSPPSSSEGGARKG